MDWYTAKNQIFSQMIDTIGQTYYIFNRWINTLSIDRYYQYWSFNYLIQIIVF
jgi:hypothetical protein